MTRGMLVKKTVDQEKGLIKTENFVNFFAGSAGRTRFAGTPRGWSAFFFGHFEVTKHYKNMGFGLRDLKNAPQGTAAL